MASQIQANIITNAAGSGPPSAPYGITGKTPTVQKFLSGSGTYTTPSNVLYLRVRMVGGGGGGGGSGTAAGSAATSGGSSTFGSSLLTCGGGTNGATYSSGASTGGAATLNAPALGLAIAGEGGGLPSISQATSCQPMSGYGGKSVLGGGGAANGVGTSGGAAIANSGSGGAGGGGVSVATLSYSGGGGAAGGYIEAIIPTPSATYAYSVGTAGAGGGAGTAGASGGAGAAGYIEVTEFYQ